MEANEDIEMKRWMKAVGISMGLAVLFVLCGGKEPPGEGPATVSRDALQSDAEAFWNSATIYFLLTDRFANGDPSNDTSLGRKQDGAVLRSYMGGDLAGLLEKLEAGYFDSLGVTAIWTTPFLEQIHGSVDEGTGKTWAFHGYWTKDWTAVEPNLGTAEDLRAVVNAAHARGIRVIMDAIINHTGPVTPLDPVWPDAWVRTGPRCTWDSYEGTVPCTLVDNLPDVRTESDAPVELPDHLLAKWEAEGRLETELAELDEFFARTGYPRAPRFYIIKWLTDWVREFGFDGYRVDTARNFDEDVALELRAEADRAFEDWKRANPDKVLDDLPFYMFGEVYHYDIANGRKYDFGDVVVDYFDHGYDGLINFGLRNRDGLTLDQVFGNYSAALTEGEMRGLSVINYVDSHDDFTPWDPNREQPLEAGTRLLLAPGAAQIYYGDELARTLTVEGAEGDATFRSFMNWEDLPRGGAAPGTLDHWRKLAKFRAAHPAVGAGEHVRLSAEPWIFSRTLETERAVDRVLVGIGLGSGTVSVPVFGVFPDGTTLVDSYSGRVADVEAGSVTLRTDSGIVLLAPVSPAD
jgi:alpha-amylase